MLIDYILYINCYNCDTIYYKAKFVTRDWLYRTKCILVIETNGLQISRRRSDRRREIYNPIDGRFPRGAPTAVLRPNGEPRRGSTTGFNGAVLRGILLDAWAHRKSSSARTFLKDRKYTLRDSLSVRRGSLQK